MKTKISNRHRGQLYGSLATRLAMTYSLLACGMAGAAGVVEPQAAAEVIAADQDFAATAAEAGLASAYDRYLADEAVLFRPLPVTGREWLATHEPASGRLAWTPSGARVACDGHFAVTIGTWTYTTADGRSSETGQYLTAWQRGEQGWRVVLDQAVDAGEVLPDIRNEVVPSPCDGRASKPRALAAVERKLNSAVRSVPGVSGPVEGRLNAQTMGAFPHEDTADLAVTHGEIVSAARGASIDANTSVAAVYVRVWQRIRSKWSLLFESVTPVSP